MQKQKAIRNAECVSPKEGNMKGVIDRIESDYAVVLCTDEEVKVDIPLKLLPKEVKEGTHLSLSIKINDQSEKEQRAKTQNLLNKLKNK